MATTKNTTKTVARSTFDAIANLVPLERVAAKMASKTNEGSDKVLSALKGLANRLNHNDGIIAERSRETVELYISTTKELGGDNPVISLLLEQLDRSIVFRSAKTGPRDSSWIRDLRAGVPRLEKDGNYYAYKMISLEEAKAICADMEIELPVVEAETEDEVEEGDEA